jgi:hypothetical protein
VIIKDLGACSRLAGRWRYPNWARGAVIGGSAAILWVNALESLPAMVLARTGYHMLDYGELRLNPFWHSLRGDPRIEKIVNSLAPK